MDLDQIIKGRRSIRKFRNEEVPKELLREIIDTALWAPSGMNRQDWDVVVVAGKLRDRLVEVVTKAQKQMKPRLEELLFPEKIIKFSLQFFENLGGAPVVILVYIPKEVINFSEGMGQQERYHLEFTRYNRLLSAAALIQNIHLVAYARGLGTCWMSGPKYVESEINELIGVEDKELVSIIPVGYPDQSPPAPPRKSNVVRWLDI